MQATTSHTGRIDQKHIRRRQFRVALFDLDGTLIDSAPDLAAAVDHSLTVLGLPVAGLTNVRHWVGNGAPVLVNRALAYASQCDAQNLSAATSAQAYQQFLDYYRQHIVIHTTLYAGVETLLRHWAQFHPDLRMAIVTNKPGEFTESICQQLNIADFFDLMVSGDTLPVRKPDPLPLLSACDALGSDPQQCIMIGDSSNDLIAARRAGMTSVCVSYGYNHGKDIADHKPDVLVDSLLELM